MTSASVDDYVRALPAEVQPVLEEIRRVIRASVPTSEETIKYAMPTFVLDGRSLVHVAAWKRHIGLYPLPVTAPAEIAPYDTGRGTARFPLDQPVPYELIARLAARLAEERAA
jgi:uncharacterized protein YdhG (YjbR/CyaY superfamily)